MSDEFKIGDKVVCINDDWTMPILNKIDVYTISYIGDGLIALQNISSYFSPNRFKLLVDFRKEKILKLKERCQMNLK